MHGWLTSRLPKCFSATPCPPRTRRVCVAEQRTEVPSTPLTASTTQLILLELERRNRQPQQVAGGAGAGTTLADLRRLDTAWRDLRTRQVYGLAPEFVRRTDEPLPAVPGLDVIIAGGTLGIFLAAALQHSGLRVAVVERGDLRGREQEWNISRKELYELVRLGVLSHEEAAASISVEFNPVRVGFHGSPKDVWTRDVLNLGVSPDKLIQAASQRFLGNGGVLLQRSALKAVWVHPNGVQIRMNKDNVEYALTSKLLIDAMGSQSPIVRQVRHGQKPDGVCLVVGTCARGFPADKNTTGDVIYTNRPSEMPKQGHTHRLSSSPSNPTPLHNLQTFWEAFPAGSGPSDRTTYMFTYLDAHPARPSLEELLEYYWTAMPEYQGVDLDDLEVLRVLFGIFPTYRDSPLVPTFDRILPIGDASGIQSPLSFGGFGALMRHLGRLTGAVTEAVEVEMVNREGIKYINGYNPSLSGAWMLQRAMSIPAGAELYDRDFINRLLGGNFLAMERLGEDTLKPFLQDVIQAGPLARTLFAQMSNDPGFVPHILSRVGPRPLVDWAVHFLSIVLYTAAFRGAEKIGVLEKINRLPLPQRYVIRRAVERWKFGSGLDYEP